MSYANVGPQPEPTPPPAGQVPRFWVRFWGVRGNIPAPGPDTVRYGGNTACVEVQVADQRLIFDAGTGLRSLGMQLAAQGGRWQPTCVLPTPTGIAFRDFRFLAPPLMPAVGCIFTEPPRSMERRSSNG